MRVRIFFSKDAFFTKTLYLGDDLSRDINPLDIEKTHVYVGDNDFPEGSSLDDVFKLYQEIDRSLVSKIGTTHSSMSVGDVIHVVDDGSFHMVDLVGFKKL